jgi:hypothetical protein
MMGKFEMRYDGGDGGAARDCRAEKCNARVAKGVRGGIWGSSRDKDTRDSAMAARRRRDAEMIGRKRVGPSFDVPGRCKETDLRGQTPCILWMRRPACAETTRRDLRIETHVGETTRSTIRWILRWQNPSTHTC